MNFFFKFDIYLFSTGTATTNKLGDGIPVAHCQNLKYRYSKLLLKLETNSLTVYR